MGERPAVLVIACGALAHEIVALRQANDWPHLVVQCLPADLHNRPEKIPAAVRDKIAANRGKFASIFVAYADCGTGGRLDAVNIVDADVAVVTTVGGIDLGRWPRLADYRRGNLEGQIRTLLAFLEAGREPPFELMFSLAIFLTDTQQAVREAADELEERAFLT